MRIGSTIIDIESLSIEDLRMVEHEAYILRKRKEEAESFKLRMTALLDEVREAGFDFIDKDLGYVVKAEDMTLYDNRH